ncbi:MAG: F0F1 ATP synthase subunit delta [Rhodothermales bacterium]|nr:F0F1 ATP synthase subunit delta [Rhodothermales bacterium]
MSDATVARRYAQALFREAEEQGKVERIDSDVQAVQESLEASRELERFFQSPVVGREKKEAVVAKLFDGKVDALLVRLIQLLVEKGREDIFPAVVGQYAELRDERLGVVEARVKSAMPLEPDEADTLRKALEAKTGKKVRMRIEVEPSLLGGVVVRIGDRVYDGSARHQLETLREHLTEQAYLASRGDGAALDADLDADPGSADPGPADLPGEPPRRTE